ncbi:glycoside hydrolase family 27 protein [Coniophora puteana RWD-64-598 SS2]|uniref:Alpha-galactosidase n=1 Tax=Coniophora puteana (strain RWD-64-598) TaxID=741705 RepID=A0A5M3MI07_CONPW|nr:glycoside hydrolase family 27 protein [Coniophora puteana RWD-64-598 SS2]EIW78677.1 glycoside hydrolase family 27 protein [Coniophora puteana RWD-64-598 SS2]
MLSAAALLVYASAAVALNNGVAKLPVLGFNTWNAYHCDISQELVLQQAQYMKTLGLLDAGYTQFNLDDCWGVKTRSSSGEIQYNTTLFPDMNNYTATLNSMGLCVDFTPFRTHVICPDRFTVRSAAKPYSDSGWQTCAGYVGSFDHEDQDAASFQSWGFDYLKYDNCAIPFDDVVQQNVLGKYQRMQYALERVANSTGTTFVYSLCEWGWSQVWLWGASVAHSWRIDGDIAPYWSSLTSIIDQLSFINFGSQFYGHNDMDILEIGNGNLTYDESKTHFTVWAFAKSPLLISADLSTISQENVDILKNSEILAISQDNVYGQSVSPFRWGINPDWITNATYPAQYWSLPSENGTVIMLINTLDEPADMFFNLTESPWLRAGIQYNVRDLWSHTDNGTAVRNYTAAGVPSHGVAALLLTEAGPEPQGLFPPCAGEDLSSCMAENGTSYAQ